MTVNQILEYDDGSKAFVDESNVLHVYDNDRGTFTIQGFPTLEDAWEFLMIGDFSGEDFFLLKGSSYKLEWRD